MVTTEIRKDVAWAALAARDERSRIEVMRQSFQELAALDENDRLRRLRAMIYAEYALPEAELAEFTASRLRCWVEMARGDPGSARLLGAGYDRVFSELPADIAMKRAFIVQGVATRDLSPDETDALFDIIPGLVRQLPRRHISVASEQKATTGQKTKRGIWARLAGGRA